MSTAIAITLGDVAGIGPEVVLKSLQEPLAHGVRPVLFGSLEALEREDARLTGLVPSYRALAPRLRPLTHARDGARLKKPDDIAVVDVAPEFDLSDLVSGRHDPRAAHIQLRALEAAIAATRSGEVHAIVTAPWNKELFGTIGLEARGHTEVLTEGFGAPRSVMMLAGERLRVALVTTHVPLNKVAGLLTQAAIVETGRIVVEELERLYGIGPARLAVCALNPHAGEGGTMGREELEVITPAVETLGRALGARARVEGPLPADTLFARYGQSGHAPWDAVLCMYHDQGLIPLKLLHFGQSANITLGLGAIRTSVDHGTAYDIAGTGQADGHSMRYAIDLALAMVQRVRTVR